LNWSGEYLAGLFWVHSLNEFGRTLDVSEEHCHVFSFAFERVARTQYLPGDVGWGVTVWTAEVLRLRLRNVIRQALSAGSAEGSSKRYGYTTGRAASPHLRTTTLAESDVFTIISAATIAC